MFLFSGTFFPISQLPDVLQPVAWVVPLWHGVDLCRDLVARAGERRHAPLVHLLYLLAWIVVGYVLALRQLPAPAGNVMATQTLPFAGRAARRLRDVCSAPATRGSSSSATRASTARAGSVLLSGIFEPLFYLFSVGVGVAQLVGDVELPGGKVVSYTAFVAPAMLGLERHERRALRRDVQRLLQAEVRQALRRGAVDTGDAGRHRGRRDRLGAAARRVLLRRRSSS